MNRPACLPPLLTAVLVATSCAQEPVAPPAERPRLVVLCVVDQLASWVFEAGRPFLAEDGGFRRVLREGVEFPHCAYQHACTETGPGHATIGTGAPASAHGIVRNNWWSPGAGALGYCVGEPMPAVPGLPEGRNRGPGLLLVPTLGDQVKARVPGSKVASVSWKDRSAILMGGKGADIAAWFEVSTGNLVTNTAWVATAPDWLANFNREKAIDGYHGWLWDRFGPEAAYAGLVDDRIYEVPHQNGSNARTLPQKVTGGKPEPGPPFYAEVYASPIGNTMVRLAAEAAVRGMQLGADDVPDLLGVSFSSTDLIGHQFGPDSVEARDALLRLDRELALFFTFLDGPVGLGRWALYDTADPAVGPTPEGAKARGLDAGRGLLQTRARAAAEKALAQRFGPPPAGKRFLMHAGEYSFFFDRNVLAALRGERDEATMRLEAAHTAAEAAAATQGMQAAFATEDLLARSWPDDALRASLVLALCPGRAGDVQLVVKPYWLDGVTPASHGTPHAYDREVLGLCLGPGLARGVRLDAPITPGFGVVLFAKLLGIEPPPAAVDVVPDKLFVGP